MFFLAASLENPATLASKVVEEATSTPAQRRFVAVSPSFGEDVESRRLIGSVVDMAIASAFASCKGGVDTVGLCGNRNRTR